MKHLLILLAFTGLLWAPVTVNAQIAPSNDTVACSNVNFTANIMQMVNLPSDDEYSSVVNLGFTFNFYGNNYTQCIVSANGYISFVTSNAGNYSPWPISAAIPSNANPLNSIFGPWQDIDPSVGGSIRYARVGVAPNRKFVVEYCAVPMFSCGSPAFTGQIILYEGSNNIETHITNKGLCTSWNGGAAIHGIQNSTGTIAHVVPGRNYPSTWIAANDGWQFSPTSATAYTVAPVPFNPIIMGTSVAWTINGVSAGTSPTLTVTPGNSPDTVIGTVSGVAGCGAAPTTYIDTIIVYPNPMGLSVTATQTQCSVNTGMAIASVAGGTQPITFNWPAIPSTNDTLTNLPAGTYVVQVTDGAGCVLTDSAVITQNTIIDLSLVSFTNASCYGDTNGTAVTNITGAAGTVVYNWNTSPVQTTPSSTSLPAGNWTVVATDTAGCKDSVLVTIAQPPAITSVVYPVPATCFGGSDGSAIVYTQGGAGGFTYNWNSNPSQSTQTANNLPAGTYLVTITDANNCVQVDTAIITQPQEISGTFNITPPTCYGSSDGSVTYSNVTGGTPGYNYSWNTVPPQNSATASNLGEGVYIITVYDSKACSRMDTVLVTDPDSIYLVMTNTPSACGHKNGTADLAVQGGTAPYTYNWSDGSQGASAANLAGGTYSVLVTDSNGCSGSASTTISEYLDVVADFSIPAAAGISPFSVSFNNTSTGASSYYWDFGTGDQDSVNMSPVYTFQSEGTYEVVLYACYTNACCDSASTIIEVIDEVIVPNVFTPDNDGVNDVFKLNTSGFLSMSMMIFDQWGKKVFESTDVNAIWDGNRKSGGAGSEGTYYYVIQVTRVNGEIKNYNGTVTLLRGR